MANDVKREKAIDAAKKFCEGIEAEKKLRDAIATLVAKLGRSNLSAAEGERHAESLAEAFKILKKLE